MLGLVCEKMAERVVVARQEEKDSRTRESGFTVTSIVEEDPGEEQDKEDDEDTVDERDLTGQRRD